MSSQIADEQVDVREDVGLDFHAYCEGRLTAKCHGAGNNFLHSTAGALVTGYSEWCAKGSLGSLNL
jgi:hypothetical protein